MVAIRKKGTRALRRGRVSERNRIYHVTSATHERETLFSDLRSARELISAMRHEQAAGRCVTLAFVVMPDHVHWLLQLDGAATLSGCVNNVKANAARAVNRTLGRRGPVWQRGFHDHAVRHEEHLAGIARYIVANPLRAGIARRVGEYPHWDAIWL